MSVQIVHPPIGSTINNKDAHRLCRYYSLDAEAERLNTQPEKYKPWIFDGVSGLPDHIMGIFGSGFDITYQCALPHDLAYAYGRLGDSKARRETDRTFRQNMINRASVHPAKAYLAWLFVRALGSERLGLSFSWGFAHRGSSGWTPGPLPITY